MLNTDRYVQTLAPLATDPGVQNALITAVDRQVQNNVDVGPLLDQNLPPKAAKALTGPVQGAVNVSPTRSRPRLCRARPFPRCGTA